MLMLFSQLCSCYSHAMLANMDQVMTGAASFSRTSGAFGVPMGAVCSIHMFNNAWCSRGRFCQFQMHPAVADTLHCCQLLMTHNAVCVCLAQRMQETKAMAADRTREDRQRREQRRIEKEQARLNEQ